MYKTPQALRSKPSSPHQSNLEQDAAEVKASNPALLEGVGLTAHFTRDLGAVFGEEFGRG